MSIRVEIVRRLDENLLHRMQPSVPGVPLAREILCTEEMRQWIHGPWQSAEDQARWNRLRAQLDGFVEGRLIVVGKRGFMRLLEPFSEEVWEIRSTNPEPHIRVFGRFAEPDVFVATNWWYRDDLGVKKNTIEWKQAIRTCKADWRALFHTYPPHTGTDIHDYITDSVLPIKHLK